MFDKVITHHTHIGLVMGLTKPGSAGYSENASAVAPAQTLTSVSGGRARDVRPHQLRHSIATHMHDRGADIRDVQVFLNHANLQTTQIYTHVSTKRLREVIERTHPGNHNFT